MKNDFDLRYPIGKIEEHPFSKKENYDQTVKILYIKDIEKCPSLLESAILNLSEEQLNTPYREGGWTSKQIIHHVADSHMNALVRFKLALTEIKPVIKTYDQNSWAVLPDTSLPTAISINLLKALHLKWVKILENMCESDWHKSIFHPEHKREMTMWDLIGTYAWHGKHHTAHIIKLKEKYGW